MGAYSPAPAVTSQVEQQVMQDIVQRTADALVAEGCPYRGVLFAGLMIKDGKVQWHELGMQSRITTCCTIYY